MGEGGGGSDLDLRFEGGVGLSHPAMCCRERSLLFGTRYKNQNFASNKVSFTGK